MPYTNPKSSCTLTDVPSGSPAPASETLRRNMSQHCSISFSGTVVFISTWRMVKSLYDQLHTLFTSPMVRMFFSNGSVTSISISCAEAPGRVATTIAIFTLISGSSSLLMSYAE